MRMLKILLTPNVNRSTIQFTILTVTLFMGVQGALAQQVPSTNQANIPTRNDLIATDDSGPEFRAAEKLFEQLNNGSADFHAAVLKVGRDLLRTDTDRNYTDLLEANPLVAASEAIYKKKTAETVEKGIRKNLLSMKLLVATNPGDVEILECGRKAAKAQGLTDAEINQIEFFLANGPVNAYTFSGVNERKVVVLFSGLIDALRDKDGKLMKPELEGVIGHELRHILDGHIDQSIRSLAVTMQLFKMFTQNEDFTDDPADDLMSGKANLQYKDLWNKLVDSAVAMGFGSDFSRLSTTGSNALSIQFDKMQRDTILQAVQVMNSKLNEVSKSDPEKAFSYIRNYLVGTMNILSQENLPSSVVDFYAVLNVTLRKYSVTQLNPKNFLENYSVMSSAIQRANEASADVGGYLAARGDRAGKVDGIFTGVPYKETIQNYGAYLQEIKASYHDLLAQVKQMYDQSTPEQTAETIGQPSMSHPFTAFRVVNANEAARMPDVIAFRDPLIKMLLARSQLLETRTIQNLSLEFLNQQIEKEKANLKSDGLKAADQMVLGFRNKIESLDKVIALTTQKVTALVVKIAQTPGRLNPRLLRIVDYSLARKIKAQANVKDLKGLFEQKKSVPGATEQLNELIAQEISQANILDESLKLISSQIAASVPLPKSKKGVKKISESLKAQIDLITEATQPDLSAEAAINLRSKIAIARNDKTGMRWTRITSDPYLLTHSIPTDGDRFAVDKTQAVNRPQQISVRTSIPAPVPTCESILN